MRENQEPIFPPAEVDNSLVMHVPLVSLVMRSLERRRFRQQAHKVEVALETAFEEDFTLRKPIPRHRPGGTGTFAF